MKIGFFDSGLGGLLLMESCMKDQAEHSYVYFGDTKNLPYGPKTEQEILQCITPCLLYLLEQEHCDHLIVACNTASVKALPAFVKKFPQYQQRVHGISEPTVSYLKEQNLENLLVLATIQTVNSNVYSLINGLKTNQIAMPGLVSLIEEGNKEAAMLMCRDVILFNDDYHTVLLGCTHYVWLKEALEEEYPKKQIIGQDSVTHKLVNALTPVFKSHREITRKFYVSSNAAEYQKKHAHDFILIKPKKVES